MIKNNVAPFVEGKIMSSNFLKYLRLNRLMIIKISILNVLLFSIYLSGCAYLFGFITYYDPTTYKNLTDLKPEVVALYNTFSTSTVDTNNIAAIRLKLAQMYEYENGKGTKNVETTKQIKIIQEMFDRHVNDRIKNGKWSEEHLNNNKQNIQDAFDLAIRTERLKNKNE
jgi:hypothetical protein